MAVSNQEIAAWLAANPGASDAQIAQAAQQAGVSSQQLAQVTGVPVAQVEARIRDVLPSISPVIEPRTVDMGEGARTEYFVQGTNIRVDDPNYLENYFAGAPLTESSAPMMRQNNITIYDPARQGEYVYSPEGQYLGFTQGGRDSSLGGFLKETITGTAPIWGSALAANALAGALGGAGAAGAGAGTAGTGVTGMGLGTGISAGAGGLGLSTTGATGLGINAGTGLTGTGILSGSTLGTGLLGAGAGAGLAGLTGTGVLAGSTLGTGLLGTGAGAGALGTAAAKAGTSLLGNAISGGLQLGGGLLQSAEDRAAAQQAARDITTATQTAVQGAQFRPIGTTTRFGSSQFQYDPVTGQMISAGYQLSPEAKAAQDRFVALAGRGISQAEAAQEQFAPLQTGAQSLFSLGNQYLAQSPQDVAQNYINQQMALLQPGRELELANLQNRLQQQGRAGLSVAQGGALGATTPELQALFNARAQQEALLAANAQQAGQQNVTFGAGLLGTGAQTLGNYYAGQQAAYAPYTSAMGQVTGLETAAQQPFTLSTGLANQMATAGANAGRLGLAGAGSAAEISMGRQATTNPFASLLSGLGSSSNFGQGIANIWGT